MSRSSGRFVVFQTAYPGDVVLALPIVQVLRASLPSAYIAFVTIPAAAELPGNHPGVNECISYDKRGSAKGLRGMLSMAARLRTGRFDVAIVPHRSLKSACVCRLAGIPQRIGFSTSAGSLFFTDVVEYRRDDHEITRNLALLAPLGIRHPGLELPLLAPGRRDKERVTDLLEGVSGLRAAAARKKMIALAPGSVWATKRWLRENFISLARQVQQEGLAVALIGGKDDAGLCGEIEQALRGGPVVNAAGKLTLTQSAELIRRCRAVVSNDSAPVHLAVGVRTPVVALFGPTVPSFGFAPKGQLDTIVETEGLSCRPCSIHGGNSCPIRTFDCMKRITPERVMSALRAIGLQRNGER